MKTTRRGFLKCGAAAVATAVVGSGTLEARTLKRPAKTKTVMVYRLSARGRRCSRAAKEYAANMRFATWRVAQIHSSPHPGANLRIVPIVVTEKEFVRLFTRRGKGGRLGIVAAADLRRM
jgi:hypothetical protein